MATLTFIPLPCQQYYRSTWISPPLTQTHYVFPLSPICTRRLGYARRLSYIKHLYYLTEGTIIAGGIKNIAGQEKSHTASFKSICHPELRVMAVSFLMLPLPKKSSGTRISSRQRQTTMSTSRTSPQHTLCTLHLNPQSPEAIPAMSMTRRPGCGNSTLL